MTEKQAKQLEIHERLKLEGQKITGEFINAGVVFEVVGRNALRFKGNLTNNQRQMIRLWKRRIIETISPKCLSCEIAMETTDGKDFYCPLGCSQKVN